MDVVEWRDDEVRVGDVRGLMRGLLLLGGASADAEAVSSRARARGAFIVCLRYISDDRLCASHDDVGVGMVRNNTSASYVDLMSIFALPRNLFSLQIHTGTTTKASLIKIFVALWIYFSRSQGNNDVTKQMLNALLPG